MTKDTHTAPTVRAAWSSDGTLYRITCPHCFSVHVHGPQAGHKVAHCKPGTPGKERGYVVEAPVDTSGALA